jgi:hypothetical protein
MLGTSLTVRREHLRAALPFALFVVSPLVVYPRRFLASGLFDGGDDLLSNLPFLVHSARKLFSFEIFWTPGLWLGTPVLDEPEFATFYLPRLVLLALPLVTGFCLYVLAHYVLAQAGFYAYARASGISRAGATFGALAYGYSGFLLGHRGHTMYVAAGAWAPWVLYFLARAGREPERRDIARAALCFAALPLSGAYQLTVYFAGLVTALAAVEAIARRRVAPLVPSGLAVAAGLLLAAPQILPSLSFTDALVAAPRHDPAFSTLLSYDPRILPLLVVPESPLVDAELYSRVGGVVLVFAALGAFGTSVPSRAFRLVALAAVVLMLGRHVPVLPDVLRALPVVDVFRGPVRHNFELGLSTSALAALGYDAVFGPNAAQRRPLAWGAGALLGTIALVAACHAMARSTPALDGAKAMVLAAKPLAVAAGAGALAAGFSAVLLRQTRWRLIAATGVVAAPLVEAWVATRPLDRVWPDRRAALVALSRLDGEGRRILPPRPEVGGADVASENTALLLSQAQAMGGYASMAPADAAALFDLDMLGHPKDPATLVWSRLPSVFGVTHLVLPDTICDPVDVVADPRDRTGTCKPAGTNVPAGASLACTEELGGGVSRVGVSAESLSKEGESSFRVVLDGRGPDAGVRDEVVVEAARGRWLRGWFGGTALPRAGVVSVIPLGPRVQRFESLSLVEDRLEPVVSIEGPAAAARGPSVPGGIGDADRRLREVPFSFPDWAGRARHDDLHLRLFVTARAVDEAHGGVLAEVNAMAQGAPKRTWMEVRGERLGAELGSFARFARLPRDAAEPVLRVVEGRGTEVDSARLYAARSQPILSIAGTPGTAGNDFAVEGHAVRFQPGALMTASFHLPVRPITVSIEAEPGGPTFPVVAGVRAFRAETPGTERLLPPLEGGGRASFTVELSPDVAKLALTAKAVDGRGRLRLRATSACATRHYERVARLGGGLALYENHDALPRVFAVGAVRPVSGAPEVRRILADDAAFDPRATALVQALPTTEALGQGRILDAEFGAERVRIDVRAPDDRATFVVVNDHYAPGWHAAVDGAPTPIFRVNGLVRGLLVPAGSHVVTMWYPAPRSFFIGAVLAAIGLVLCLCGDALARRAADARRHSS